MTSLQQVVKDKISDRSSYVLAVHRRSLSLLMKETASNTVFAARQGNSGKWGTEVPFSVPVDVRIIGGFVIEAYNCFVLMGTKENRSTTAIFLDLSCRLMNSWDIPSVSGVVSADVDQSRREIIAVSSNGDMSSIVIRSMSDNPKNPNSKLIFEALVALKSKIPLAPKETPRQIVAQDLTGVVIVLKSSGTVLCFETATHTLVWELNASLFVYRPIYICANKFGPGFFIYTQSDENLDLRLEYWSPPDTSVACNAGQFRKTTIPITAKVICLAIETISMSYGTAAVIIQADCKVRLWRIGEDNVSITLEAELMLTSKYTGIFPYRTLDKTTRKGGVIQTKDPIISMGTILFTAGDGIPDSPLAITFAVDNVFALFSVHKPTSSDREWWDMPKEVFTSTAQESRQMMQTNFTETFSDKTIRTTFNDDDTAEFDNREVPVASFSEGGRAVMFAPNSAIDSSLNASRRRSLAIEMKEGVAELVLPSALLVTQRKSSSQSIALIRRAGIYDCNDVSERVLQEFLGVSRGSFAFRARKLLVLTNLNELFWMPLPPDSQSKLQAAAFKPTPLKAGLDVAKSAHPTCLTCADVFLRLPQDKLTDSSDYPNAVGGGLLGELVLSLVGDSNGQVHYYITSNESVVRSGQFQAYNGSPIVSILTTGDAVRPLWRIGTSATTVPIDSASRGGAASMKVTRGVSMVGRTQITCIPIPGSGIATMDRDGDVRVWQPVFTLIQGAKASVDRVLSVTELSWKMTGTFSAISNPQLFVSSACLDPTCSTILVSSSGGHVLQWNIPGLVNNPSSEGISTSRESIFACKRHDAKITSMRVWLDAPSTSILDAPNTNGMSSGARLGASNNTLGYTLQQLKLISGNSSFATCSTDCSIVLWRFTPLSKPSRTENSLFITPVPCRRLFFSTSPEAAIAYPIPSSAAPSEDHNVGTGSRLVWRLSTIIRGAVTTVSESHYYSMFDSSGFGGESTGATLEPRGLASDEAYDEADEFISLAHAELSNQLNQFLETQMEASTMPTIGNVVLPNKLITLTPKCLDSGLSSWNLLHSKWGQRIEVTDVPTGAIETRLSGLGEILTEHPRHDKLYRAIELPARPRSPSPERLIAEIPRAPGLPQRKIELGTDPEISAMPRLNRPDSIAPIATVQADGTMKMLVNGLYIVARPDQVDQFKTLRKDTMGKVTIAPTVKEMTETDLISLPEELRRSLSLGIDLQSDAPTPLEPSQLSIFSNMKEADVTDINIPVPSDDLSKSLALPSLVEENKAEIAVAQTEPTAGTLDVELPKASSIQDSTFFSGGANPSNSDLLALTTVLDDKKEIQEGVSIEIKDANDNVILTRVLNEEDAQSFFTTDGNGNKGKAVAKIKAVAKDSHLLQQRDMPKSNYKYISKSKVDGSIKKTILQPYVTPRLGFVPPKDMFERNLEGSKQRVTIVKPKEEDIAEATTSTPQVSKKPKVAKAMLGADLGGEEEAQPDHYFDWRAEPLFVLRQPDTYPTNHYRTEGELNQHDLNAMFSSSSDGRALELIPDDHPLFSGIEALLKPEHLVESMTKAELSHFKRLNEDQKDAFLEERKAEYQSQIQNSKHAFREMVFRSMPSKGQSSSMGLRIDDASNWGFVAKAIQSGLLTKAEIIDLLHKAIEDERNELIALATSTEDENEINREFNKMNEDLYQIPEDMLGENSDKFITDFLPSLKEKLEHISVPSREGKQKEEDGEEEEDNFDESKTGKEVGKKNLAKVAFGTMMRRTMLMRMKSGSQSQGAIKTQESEIDEIKDDAEFDAPLSSRKKSQSGSMVIPPAGMMSFLGFSKFMVALQKRIQRAMAPPELLEKVHSVLHNSVQFEIASDKRCTVWIVAVLEGSKLVPKSADFNNFDSFTKNPEVVSTATGVINDILKPLSISVKNLKSEKSYKFFFCAETLTRDDKKGGASQRVVDIVIEDHFLIVKTVEPANEIAEISWSSLTEYQRDMEVRAACRSLDVQMAARMDDIILPSDEDIMHRSQNKKMHAVKKFKAFVSWWTGDDQEDGFSNARVSFLSQEATYMVQQSDLRQACFEQGYLSLPQLQSLNVLVGADVLDDERSEFTPVWSRKPAQELDPEVFDDPIFQIFRSWYKGGLVVQKQLLSGAMKSRSQDADQVTVIPDSTKPIPVQDPAQIQKLVKNQMDIRTKRLLLRIQVVDACKASAGTLLDLHKFSETKKLKYSDLSTKRQQLSQEEIDAIMGSKKLLELCHVADVDVSKLPGPFMQAVSGADIFKDIAEDALAPDPPPSLMELMAGGGMPEDMPMKSWYYCTEAEKELELRIACMLDTIVELAFGDLIAVPSIEEADVDPSFIPSKAQRWTEFTNWYIGPEKIGNKNRGDESPYSPGRRLFAMWEKAVVRKSKVVLGQLFGIKSITEDPRAASRAQSRQESSSNLDPGKPGARRMTAKLPSAITENVLLGSYLDFVNTRTGHSLRVDVFSEYVKAITSSRYASVMRSLWPTAPPTQSLQFFLPRMGLLIPKPEPHSLYLKLYASRKPDGYTIKDILKWYTAEELDDDDQKMIKAEQRGKKFEEYVLWLSKEGERRTVNREQMLEEDVLSAKFRLMQQNIARSLGAIRGNPAYSAFSLIPTVPTDLGFLDDERVFLDGDGTNNEDELYDIRESMERSAAEGALELAMKKKKLLEDQKRAEEAEKQRLEKRERDKRINEGTVRRRQIRAKLALLKEERELFRLVEAREKAAADEVEKKRLAEENALRMIAELKQFDQETQRRELIDMAAEEARQRHVESTIENQIGMIREDRLSQLREERDIKLEKYQHRRTKQLQELYAPTQPFSPEVADRAPVEQEMDDIPAVIWDLTDETIHKNKKHLVLRCEQDPTAPTTLSGTDIAAMKKNQRGKLMIEKKKKRITIRGDTKSRTRTLSPDHLLFDGTDPPHGFHESKDFDYLDGFQIKMWTPEVSTTPSLDPEAISNRLMAAPELEPRPLPWHEQTASNPASRGEIIGDQLRLPALSSRGLSDRPSSNPVSLLELSKTPISLPSLVDNFIGDDIFLEPRVPPRALAQSRQDMALPSDMTFAISKDINGLQNRKMLLSASLATLDKKKLPAEISKRRREDRLRLENKYIVQTVAKDKKEVTAYLSQSYSSDAINDKFYLMASEPVQREADSITNSNKESIQAFREELFRNLAQFESEESCVSSVPDALMAVRSSAEQLLATKSIISAISEQGPINTLQGVMVETREFDDEGDTISISSKVHDSYISPMFSPNTPAPMTLTTPTAKTPARGSAKTRTSGSRPLPSIVSEAPVAKPSGSMRQTDIPPPFYRPTFGVKGKKKSIVVKIAAPGTVDQNGDDVSLSSAQFEN